MSPRRRLWLLFGALAAATTAVLAATLWLAGTDAWLLAPALFLIVTAQALAWLYLDRRWVQPATALAREIELLVHARAGRAMAPLRAHALGRLPDAVAALARRWRASEDHENAAIGRAMARAAEQQSRLEALLRDLSDGVIACSVDRRILLFNDAALRLLAMPVELGLDRPLDRLLAREPIVHAFELLRERHAAGDAGASSLREEFVCATADGARLLRCRMALIVGQERAIGGFMLDFTDATERQGRIERQAEEVAGRVEALRRALRQTIPDEDAAKDALERRIEALHAAADAMARSVRPTAALFSSDLVRAVNRRLGDAPCSLVAVGPGAWLEGDGYHLTLLLERLARRAAAEEDVRSFDLEAHQEDAGTALDLVWPGPPPEAAALERWLDERLDPDMAGPSLRDVLRRHGATLQSAAHERAGHWRLRLPLPRPARGRIVAEAPALPPRPEFYDFEILARHRERAGPMLERPLGALTYVVFDSETTGLDPGRDRIVQIAAVRIVNRRLLSGELFDALVDPGRPIDKASIRFHGITDAMVAGRPPIAVVLPQFHRFARDAVLVAHNAAFDMAFLRHAESEAGVSFDQPVLDTLLISAVLHDHESAHTLDAIAARFGIALVDRHRALGDAMGTAQILLRMLDLLEAAGIATLGAALAATERATALRRRQRAQFGREPDREPEARADG
jgi:DNA polymerase-3 subunit epsilon